MCSNTHSALRGDVTAWRVWRPRGVNDTTSPGWMSRRNLAPMMSNAQVSDATQYASSPSRPSDSGRMPRGSRNATIRSLVITTVEYAPSTRAITSTKASSSVSASCVDNSAAMISESDVERNVTPRRRNSECSSTTLTRLPLCASATSRLSARHTGWEFSHDEAQVVEYRTWPTAM